MAVRPRRRDSGFTRPPAHKRTKHSSRSTSAACTPATLSGSGFTPATRFAATRSAHSRGIAGRPSSLVAFTRRSIPARRRGLGGAHAVVKGDGDVVWPLVLNDATHGRLDHIYDGGRVDAERFVAARWELLSQGRYMWGSVQTVRGCPKHCSFCSVWRTDGQKPRQRRVDAVIDEIVELRRRGCRFIALADDNFYPVTLADLAMAERQRNIARLDQLKALRAERFELMDR